MKRIVVLSFVVFLLLFSFTGISQAQKSKKVISIPASAFEPVRMMEDGIYYNSGNDVHYTAPIDRGPRDHHDRFTAPVILPNGTVITKIKVYSAQSSRWGGTLYFMKSEVVDGQAEEKIITTIYLPGDMYDNDIRIFSKSFLMWQPVIDNINCTNFLIFSTTTQEAGDIGSLHHVEIYYKDPKTDIKPFRK